ncbi:hypothetical protein D6779_02635 [Candidatus Parcubacteria bacterium]|nr:MAG: hypothetical protein D6779_02635 [Candidatus Parcubacteria bacterium]
MRVGVTKEETLKYFLLFLALLLTGCASKIIPLGSPVTAVTYNDVASKYMPRPTFAEVQKFNGDDDRLVITMQGYGIGADSAVTMTFVRQYVDDYLKLIDKYLHWDELASKRGDIINREIGRAGLWAGAEVRFSIFSGNQISHYLVTEICGLGLCSGDNALMFDRNGAIALKNLLSKFKAGNFKEVNESIYQ